ncbi:type II toxin-antitoxin system RelE family toxin [Hydrogenivirga sp.]
MSYRVEFLKEAYEELKRLDRPVQELIKEKIEKLSQNPEALKNNIKPLKGKYSGLYRLRVGNYRVIYRMERDRLLILIIRIGHRREIY